MGRMLQPLQTLVLLVMEMVPQDLFIPAAVCEFLLQISPHFLKQRQGECLNSLNWSTCLCKYTALHDPDSAFCHFSP